MLLHILIHFQLFLFPLHSIRIADVLIGLFGFQGWMYRKYSDLYSNYFSFFNIYVIHEGFHLLNGCLVKLF